jgi:hypothetical protein
MMDLNRDGAGTDHYHSVARKADPAAASHKSPEGDVDKPNRVFVSSKSTGASTELGESAPESGAVNDAGDGHVAPGNSRLSNNSDGESDSDSDSSDSHVIDKLKFEYSFGITGTHQSRRLKCRYFPDAIDGGSIAFEYGDGCRPICDKLSDSQLEKGL